MGGGRRIIESSHFKYGLYYKPREIEYPIKKLSALVSLSNFQRPSVY